MKIKGIKRGQTIELLEQANYIPDGAEILVELELTSAKNVEIQKSLTDEERLFKLNQLFGIWKDQTDLIENFDEIDQQRHAYQGRKIDLIDNQGNS